MFTVTGWRSGQVFAENGATPSEALICLAEGRRLRLFNLTVVDEKGRQHTETDLLIMAAELHAQPRGGSERQSLETSGTGRDAELRG